MKISSPVEICENHTGKMEGIQSISTSVVLNRNCQKNQKIRGSICSKCFAEAMMGMYNALEAKVARNTKVLTERVLNVDELPDTSGQSIFRFESFGDLNNVNQLENYLNIAKKNPKTRFTLWTKQYELVCDYFLSHDVPNNFTLILSSLMLNKKIDLTFMKKTGKFKPGQLKSFTVYDKEYIFGHHKELNLNCGSRCCIRCRKCYDQNEIEEISEILKSDQSAVAEFLNWKDPCYIEKVAVSVDDILNLWKGGE